MSFLRSMSRAKSLVAVGPSLTNPSVRISMDTNLWSYIGDQGQSSAFEALAAKSTLVVVVPPSTLLEVLRLPVEAPRRRIIEALSAGPRVRLPSEAQLESDEVVSEARRTRPTWRRPMRDTAKIASLNAYWTKRVWRLAREHPEGLHEYLKRELPLHAYLHQKQREQRSEVLRAGVDVGRLSSLKATPMPDTPLEQLGGWDGCPACRWPERNSGRT